MTLRYLVTGSTGGVGGGVIEYFERHLQRSEFAASSSREENRPHFDAKGISFRHADYSDIGSLVGAFEGVENLLFVSSNTFNNELRSRQHKNVVDAAKKVGVGHVWYTSLAFGGRRSDSKVDVQQAHLVTEAYLKESGINYTSIREGFYAEAFPLFLNWYPETKEIFIPSAGRMTFTSRTELAEATAKIMMKGGYDRQIVLFVAPRTYSFSDLVNIINETTGRNVKLNIVSKDDYVRLSVQNDVGRKSEEFFKKRISWFDGVSIDKDAETLDPLLGEILGREPKDGKQILQELLCENPNYIWHQNYKPGK